MFSSGIKLKEDDNISIQDLESPPPEMINLGQSTKEQSNDEKKTWDGYGKFNNIPINPDINKVKIEPQMSKEEQLKENLLYYKN